jgi:diaminohydroxyphosphoribosylaminopyrimidine deaminase / 5-amino-6-(5-phosphoribosylamino)uracil reductase
MMNHEQYMQRCLELAGNGLGRVAPNPLVGCVIVYDETIIGEGFHAAFGGPHAEINAINSVKSKDLLKKSTLYVNLEPCCHHGKTPPCADRIISEGIPSVVIGMQDPFPKVSGKGIDVLRKAGIHVESGILESECQWLNRRFIRFHTSQRPYIILKWAQTLDGFIDRERDSEDPQINWITDENTRILVHKWRSEEQAVMIGAKTAVKDDPRLTIRDWTGKNPIRIVVDHEGDLSNQLHVFDDEAETMIFTEIDKVFGNKTRTILTDFSENALPFIFRTLYENDVQSVIIEGGRQLLTSVIEAALWDEARIFTGDRYFFKGVRSPDISGKVISSEHMGKDILVTMMNV